jgi:hypothetical protein
MAWPKYVTILRVFKQHKKIYYIHMMIKILFYPFKVYATARIYCDTDEDVINSWANNGYFFKIPNSLH